MNNSKVVRFGVSLETNLLDVLEQYKDENKIENRSQAIRHLLKNIEIEQKSNSDQLLGGAILLTYDHHQSDKLDIITKIQHNYMDIIISTQHIHISHDICMEIIALKGRAAEMKQLASELKALKGNIYASLSITRI